MRERERKFGILDHRNLVSHFNSGMSFIGYVSYVYVWASGLKTECGFCFLMFFCTFGVGWAGLGGAGKNVLRRRLHWLDTTLQQCSPAWCYAATCSPTWCYVDDGVGWGGVGSCTCAHTSRDSTVQLYVLFHLHTYVMLQYTLHALIEQINLSRKSGGMLVARSGFTPAPSMPAE